MDIRPLRDYLRAHDALAAGNRDEALSALASAMDLDEPNHVLQGNLEQFMDPDSIAGDAMLRMLVRETERRPSK